jgi:hypothetical protein
MWSLGLGGARRKRSPREEQARTKAALQKRKFYLKYLRLQQQSATWGRYEERLVLLLSSQMQPVSAQTLDSSEADSTAATSVHAVKTSARRSVDAVRTTMRMGILPSPRARSQHCLFRFSKSVMILFWVIVTFSNSKVLNSSSFGCHAFHDKWSCALPTWGSTVHSSSNPKVLASERKMKFSV